MQPISTLRHRVGHPRQRHDGIPQASPVAERQRVPGTRSNGRRRRSRNRPPLSAPASWAAASQTSVSAPSSGVRSTGRISRWNVGSASARPGVSAQPGCIAFTAIPSPAGAGPIRGRARPGRASRERRRAAPSTARTSTAGRRASRRCVYIPPDVTAMIRARSERRSSGSRPAVRANGPTTSVASVASMPSGPSMRVGKIAPALSMRTSSRGSVARIRAAAARTDASEPMSTTTIGKRSSPWRGHQRRRGARPGGSRSGRPGSPARRAPRALGRRPAQPGRRPGDQRPSPGERAGTGAVQPKSAATDLVADTREAADDRQLEAPSMTIRGSTRPSSWSSPRPSRSHAHRGPPPPR